MSYGYYSEWKQLIETATAVDCICFKLVFYGGYAIKVIRDGYFVPVIGCEMSIQIPKNQIRDALDWLQSNGYRLHEHSVVQY